MYSAGVFILPLTQEFHWSRADIALGPAIVSAVAVFANPIMGATLDRVGPYKIAIVGAVAHAAAFAHLAAIDANIWSWWAAWGLVAVGSVGVSLPVWLLGVASRFDRSRGLAVAVTFLGSAFASMSIPIATRVLMKAYGWRGAYCGLGALTVLTGVLPSLVMFTLRGRPTRTSTALNQSPRAGLTIRQSLASTKFWRIALACFFATAGVIALIVHFVPMMTEKGLSADRAAAIAGTMGLAGVVGRLVTGYLLDRIAGPIVAAGAYFVPVVACLVLRNSATDTSHAIAIALAIGLALGSEMDVMAYLATRYFGLRHYGLLFGILTGVVSAGAGVGPVVVGAFHDRFHSYDGLAFLLTATFSVSAVLAITLGRYPDQSTFGRTKK